MQNVKIKMQNYGRSIIKYTKRALCGLFYCISEVLLKLFCSWLNNIFFWMTLLALALWGACTFFTAVALNGAFLTF
jgi:hypothetical protein